MSTPATGPENWISIMVEEMDFEKAFKALEGYNHFHTSTLRGKVRMLMMDLEGSWHHFAQAEHQGFIPGNLPVCARFYLCLRHHVTVSGRLGGFRHRR